MESTHIFLTKTLRSIDSSLIPSCSARAWYTCSRPHPKHTPATPTINYLGGLLHHHLTDVDHSELLKEMEECLVEVFTAMLGEMEISHIHQLQNSGRGRGRDDTTPQRERREVSTCRPAGHPWSHSGQHWCERCDLQ